MCVRACVRACVRVCVRERGYVRDSNQDITLKTPSFIRERERERERERDDNERENGAGDKKTS